VSIINQQIKPSVRQTPPPKIDPKRLTLLGFAESRKRKTRYTVSQTTRAKHRLMDETYLLQILSMFFFSVWKTYIGPLIAVGANFAYWEMLLFNMGPALFSAAASLFIPDLWMAKRKAKPKGFNKNLRKVLKIWRRYGKTTSLLLAPVLLGIPSYALIARRLKERSVRIMFDIAVATFAWCSIIYWASIEGLLIAENYMGQTL